MSNIGAIMWDDCKTDNDKLRFINDLNVSEVASSTKYWIREWLRSQNWESEDIQNVLGYAWK